MLVNALTNVNFKELYFITSVWDKRATYDLYSLHFTIMSLRRKHVGGTNRNWRIIILTSIDYGIHL